MVIAHANRAFPLLKKCLNHGGGAALEAHPRVGVRQKVEIDGNVDKSETSAGTVVPFLGAFDDVLEGLVGVTDARKELLIVFVESFHVQTPKIKPNQ